MKVHSAFSIHAPDAALKALNNAMCDADTGPSNRAEICVMVPDRTSHTLAVTAAGDFLPEVRTPENEMDQLDRSKTGLPLGIEPSIDYTTQDFEPGAGTSVFWISGYTTQIMNSSSELYGLYGIPDKVKAAPREPHLAVEWIANDIRHFPGNCDPREDICVMCLQRTD